MRKTGLAVVNHLSVEDLRKRMSEAFSIDQFRRYQVIYLRATSPELPVSKIAELCSVAYRTVTQWTWIYNTYGADEYTLTGRGGRRNAHLSEEDEIKLLESLNGKADRGQVITVLNVKKAAEKVIGRELPKDYAYDLLHRHRWRKVMPHTHHPKKDTGAQEAFKKTTRPCWLPPEKN